MGMNKKSQHILVGLMLSFMGIIMVLGVFSGLKDVINDVRAVDQLDCTNSSISDGIKATCVIVDYSGFGWGGIGIAVSIGMIGLFATLASRKK